MFPARTAPDLDRYDLPEEERTPAWALRGALSGIDKYTSDFQAALRLFDFSSFQIEAIGERARSGQPQEHDEENQEVFNSWLWVAARDGAMTIFHFGKAMEGIKGSLRESPTLEAKIDRTALRSAANLFRSEFPNFEAVRHGVAHAAEITKDTKAREKNAFDGSYESPGVKIGEVKGLMVNILENRNFSVTIDKKIVSYEISSATLAKLEAVKHEFFAAFTPVSRKPWRPEPT